MWGIYKGARILLWGWTSHLCVALAPHYFIKLCTFKPLPLIEKEKRESLTNPLFCHSEGARSATEESLPESLVAKLVCHSEP
ncbi:hypothetical protein [Helicobacter marmotae]|uniref:hypothetical protein n=1 Tax=Helicobacter marmotae TaxID=152490 RepID=UPI0011C06AFE|nr:hypothetical protein [Helicobacter marmotae]